ncbi:diaminopimelate epimerase [Paenibacillus lautus]|uniref:diaminopimelate epimerase n=1 Tax=Paenibacillus lautus TaxID=1401 RepID=UPI002DBD1A15|nr:diaminopimelate epimerase [Paenibacillus lautus]MEC0201354.1 diaminopimelate epimerase [Paenibacillus lautus]
MKQKINFVKCNPTQNMTILINTMLPSDEHKRIASKIMSYDNVYAEQVGFIEPSMNQEADAFLQMAGGEFCGNACMALAAYLAELQEMECHEGTEFRLEVSGAEQLVACRITKNREDYRCRVNMPLPVKMDQTVLQEGGAPVNAVAVRYSDFVHFVIEVEHIDVNMKNQMLSLAKRIGPFLDTSMLGILLYHASSSQLTPLIYVPKLNSAVWERGCGSGTASIGAYLAWKNRRNIEAHIHQPGGTMLVKALYDQDRLTHLEIEGSVGIVAQGTAFIDMDFNLSVGEGIHEISNV